MNIEKEKAKYKTKVLKKRRKMGGFSIEQTDNKMFALDFFREMRFNIHEGCESPRPSSSYNVDDGYRRSAKGRAEGISSASLPPRCEDFRQTDCDLTQLWKAKAPKEQPWKQGNLSG